MERARNLKLDLVEVNISCCLVPCLSKFKINGDMFSIVVAYTPLYLVALIMRVLALVAG